MKRIVVFNIIAMLIGYVAYGQEQRSKLQQADLLFNRYEYYNAARLYTGMADKKNPDIKILERLATCYRKMNDYGLAEKWYAKAAANPKSQLSTQFYYAEVLLTNQKFEAAKAQYKVYGDLRAAANDPNLISEKEVSVKLASCDSAAVWMKEQSRFSVKNARSLNTKYSDWGLSYFGKSGLVFTSDRPGDEEPKISDDYRWTGNPWLRLFLTSSDEGIVNELPVIRKNYSSFISDYHVGPMVLNSTEDTAYVTISTRAFAADLPIDKKENKNDERIYTRRLELILVVKKEGRWEYLKGFPYNDVKKYSVGHAALSKNGNLLYFTSDMPGGMGKTDIWYTEKQKDGSWANPVNCGPEINTSEEEAFATVGVEDELYFSSKGRIGMGGYDIYRCKGEKASWTKAQNLKYPVNSTYDDFYLSTMDGILGYLSSNRAGGLGDDDIYSFTYQAPELIKPEVVEPLKYEVGKTYALSNIYYDFDKSNVRPDAAIELDKLVTILKEYPGMRIELGSHTDSRGNDQYNLLLSQRRANSAVAYLVSKGIDRSRLTAKGYGESKLLNRCANGVHCTEAEHQMNRRTEFFVKSL